MSEPVLLIDSSDPLITTLTLNRPEKRNALSVELMIALRDAVQATAKDANRRVIILRGAGPAFCAGLDLQEASGGGDSSNSARTLKSLYEAICLSPLVTIATAHGAAMGGGAGLIAACDVAIAADDLRLAYPEVRRGLVAALVTCLIRRQVGERTVRQLILVGQAVSAKESLAMGLVNRVVSAAELLPTAVAIAREVCLGAPGAIDQSKRLLNILSPRPISGDLEAALKFHLDARHSAEATEGMAAFLDKRPPRWPSRTST